jgi:hypothetical protein
MADKSLLAMTLRHIRPISRRDASERLPEILRPENEGAGKAG